MPVWLICVICAIVAVLVYAVFFAGSGAIVL